MGILIDRVAQAILSKPSTKKIREKTPEDVEDTIIAGLPNFKGPLRRMVLQELNTLRLWTDDVVSIFQKIRKSEKPSELAEIVSLIRVMGTLGGRVQAVIALGRRMNSIRIVKRGVKVFNLIVLWTENMDGVIRGLVMSALSRKKSKKKAKRKGQPSL